jgi:hypothetical protein
MTRLLTVMLTGQNPVAAAMSARPPQPRNWAAMHFS